MEPRLKLAPPWSTYVNKVTALLDGDPQIAINYDANAHTRILAIACNNGDKVTALQKLFPSEVKFGNVILKVTIDGVPSNRAFGTNEELMNVVFEGNPAFSYVRAVDGIIGGFTYVVFKNTVVQFFNDNLDDIHGVVSTLYEDIARELFADADLHSVCYNTDIETKLGNVPAMWP